LTIIFINVFGEINTPSPIIYVFLLKTLQCRAVQSSTELYRPDFIIWQAILDLKLEESSS